MTRWQTRAGLKVLLLVSSLGLSSCSEDTARTAQPSIRPTTAIPTSTASSTGAHQVDVTMPDVDGLLVAQRSGRGTDSFSVKTSGSRSR